MNIKKKVQLVNHARDDYFSCFGRYGPNEKIVQHHIDRGNSPCTACRNRDYTRKLLNSRKTAGAGLSLSLGKSTI